MWGPAWIGRPVSLDRKGTGGRRPAPGARSRRIPEAWSPGVRRYHHLQRKHLFEARGGLTRSAGEVNQGEPMCSAVFGWDVRGSMAESDVARCSP